MCGSLARVICSISIGGGRCYSEVVYRPIQGKIIYRVFNIMPGIVAQPTVEVIRFMITAVGIIGKWVDDMQ